VDHKIVYRNDGTCAQMYTKEDQELVFVEDGINCKAFVCSTSSIPIRSIFINAFCY
jgi:hypothetical protein